jgi:trigger factor
MLEWATVKEHRAADITLLCDEHHRQAGTLISNEQIASANRSPRNLQSGESKYLQLVYEGNECDVRLGRTKFQVIGQPPYFVPLLIDRMDMVGFSFEAGRLLLILKIYDEYNQPILQVINNELVYAASAWDVTFQGRILTIRDAPRAITVEIEFEPPKGGWIRQGLFRYNGLSVAVTENDTIFFDAELKPRLHLVIGELATNGAGFVIGDRPPGVACGAHVQKIKRTSYTASEVLAAARQARKQAEVESARWSDIHSEVPPTFSVQRSPLLPPPGA